ncbi:fumarate hydratase subunit alpha [Proteiniborus ethanoligenes]|uniref:Fumarate hydratase subunit alpha n=1 Tax=Proteiniborus ethanoligenes TaxID=415015 RepID=A0A1H3LFW5_9FIRM|nr:fumarate hydratase [Proteiniborus ethanoligenes]SDY63200.1 fumarate hydratase subunit alpha [Proteiniborus ethanoligenes]
MRQIDVEIIQKLVAEKCISSNIYIEEDIQEAFINAKKAETSSVGNMVLDMLIKNAEVAKENETPLCQDTGMVVAFVEVGQEVHFTNGSITDAINKGVIDGYREGYLRKSVVEDPLIRNNTKDNSPAVIYYNIVPGDKVKIELMFKGFGSENMSQIKMLKPSDGEEGVVDFVLKAVKEAGPNPCPPIIVGVGIGGTMDKAANLAKHALIRPIGSKNNKEHLAKLEEKLLEKINALGIGPQGLGGLTTALDVHVEAYPTHIAGLPVAVNINCHSSRHSTIIL